MTDVAAPSSVLWTRATTVLSQTVLISALLYYFGWVRSQATWSYFGVDTGLLGYGTADYALRSINSAFLPLIGSGIAALGAAALHRTVLGPAARATPSTRRRRMADATILVARVGGVLLMGVAVTGLLLPVAVGNALGVALPLSLLAAACLLSYADHLRACGHRPDRRVPPRTPGLRGLLLTGLALLGLLWSVALYAQATGQDVARSIAAGLRNRPSVTLYSAERLSITGPGITVDTLEQDRTKYHFRYSGLVSLTQTSERYVLVAAGWRKGSDAVYVVPAGDGIRVDITTR
ncbi:hypothetical protein [Amycolatopsis rifamycinica]|uniref:Uncharacterized protein n=1 Tax=Amycolatopsis rifamycinica TaxID=287986 RepID=A0A066TV50_9PSEU|nr:hypothetical protein [Amycolatopsis rifamycinica]KDN18700.1 hypothetical protein DV20_29345 [Amycolatopsis rifamycinica]